MTAPRSAKASNRRDTGSRGHQTDDGTPQETLAQIPRAVKTITALVVDPEHNLGKAMWNTGRIFAQADPTTQWHLVDAAVTVAQTLRDTLTGLIGTPPTLTLPDEFTTDVPDAVAAGAQVAHALVHTDNPTPGRQFHDDLVNEQVPGETGLGAYLMACALATQCVQILADGTGLTPTEAWSKVRPLLMP